MLNAIPYVGKVEKDNNASVPAFHVRKLSIHDTYRKYYDASISLVE